MIITKAVGNYVRLARASINSVIQAFYFDGTTEHLIHTYPIQPTFTKLIFATYYYGTVRKPEIFIQ